LRKRIPLEKVEEIILYFSTSVFGQNSVDDILWDLTRNCIARLGFVDCVVYLKDKKRNMLIQKAAYGNKNPVNYEISKPIEIPVGSGITGGVAATGIPEIVGDTSLDPRYIIDDQVRLSEITVPLIFNEEVIGVIDSEHPEKGFFTEQHLRILQTISSICVNKIVRTQAVARMEENQKKMTELSVKVL
jgi:two-component system, LytTR family, sensor kinase